MIDPAYIDDVFGKDGLMAKSFAGYVPRAGQLDLVRSIDRVIATNDVLLAEAGCGTGKSVAYLVPAIANVSPEPMTMRDEEGKTVANPAAHVVVVTGNIALTEQLIGKDLPMLQKILPWKFTYGLMKGRNNYACIDKFYGFEADRTARKQENLVALSAVRNWVAKEIKDSGSGDISTMPAEPEREAWSRFSVSGEECHGKKCQYYRQCFGAKAATRAKEANVTVTNYHMFFTHLRFGNILSPYSIAILDEVHLAAGISRDFFGFRATAEAVKRTARRLAKSDDQGSQHVAAQVQASANVFFQALSDYRRGGRYKTRLKQELVGFPPVSEPFDKLERAMIDAEKLLRRELSSLELRIEVGQGDEHRLRREHFETQRAAERSSEMRQHLEAMLRMEHDEWVYSLEEDTFRGNTNVVVLGKPISVAPMLRAKLWDTGITVIGTSATITATDGFGYAKRELGCTSAATTEVGSPFDWSHQALLVTPRMPEPNEPDFPEAVAAVTGRVIELCGGRTLGLFTSNKMRDLVFQALRAPGAGVARTRQGYRLLVQGEISRTKLVEEFKRDVTSVLLGTESFWAGVDVPGEALTAVVIDRIPFPTPDDPILDAISEKDKKWFHHHSLPRATIQLKQGFGRLIRSEKDRGVVVLCDGRIHTKSYGKQILKALPPVRISESLSAITGFLAEKLATKVEKSDEDFMREAFE